MSKVYILFYVLYFFSEVFEQLRSSLLWSYQSSKVLSFKMNLSISVFENLSQSI